MNEIMWMMHTTLPEFFRKMKTAAATQGAVPKECEVHGLEHLKSAKMQSLRTGRIEQSVAKLAKMENVDRLEVVVMDRVPETMHQAVIRAYEDAVAAAAEERKSEEALAAF
jgi:hypothetical protein